ncbi:ABC transporter substrate-binding protein [Halostagnicola kamekurae]|uniref:ABC-type Fe3+-hydroxamate transport system, substrate-binding protein n=1 Tax=Halostagnicola kamekurae TaxID=619731 RepID=A0A1I6RIB5_9EURY|nr:ABC transporter substrate-binding protein [Halostagnicola kamekurae]SFS64330.1 ABC-type Fe3+-hydroxamate transport system, substrate-binding protein [Halostagnicola kamekurae]
MVRATNGDKTLTRRDCVKYSGSVIGGGILAGCVGDTSQESTPSDESYSVTMSPMGTVSFDSVPQNALASSTSNIDIVAALGHGSAVQSTSSPSTSTPSLEFYYSTLDVSTDWIDFKEAGNFSKETLYELDSDVHFLDPAYVNSLDDWSKSDIDEVEETVGPFFGNMYSRKHRQPPESWRDSYRYYTLWELTEKFAEVFEEQDRFAQLNTVRETLLSDIRSKLPASSDRPTVGMVYPRLSEDAFYIHKLNQPGYFFAHTRPLEAVDVFEDITADEFGGQLVDYEVLLQADPDVLIMNYGISSYYDVASIKQSLREHSVGSELTAVQNDRLYASGNPRQGPLMNLFQLEMTAKQLYPAEFGEWPGYVDGEPYPDLPTDEHLFDRQRVADIINGDF